MAQKTVTVKQTKSTIARSEKQVKVLKGMGLGRIGKTKTLKDCPETRGMIEKVKHLVSIQD